MPIMAGADAHGPDTLLQTVHANSRNPLAVRGRAIHFGTHSGLASRDEFTLEKI
jgi:hypothetical protein